MVLRRQAERIPLGDDGAGSDGKQSVPQEGGRRTAPFLLVVFWYRF